MDAEIHLLVNLTGKSCHALHSAEHGLRFSLSFLFHLFSFLDFCEEKFSARVLQHGIELAELQRCVSLKRNYSSGWAFEKGVNFPTALVAGFEDSWRSRQPHCSPRLHTFSGAPTRW